MNKSRCSEYSPGRNNSYSLQVIDTRLQYTPGPKEIMHISIWKHGRGSFAWVVAAVAIGVGAMLQVLVIVSRQCGPRTNLAFSGFSFHRYRRTVLRYYGVTNYRTIHVPCHLADIVLYSYIHSTSIIQISLPRGGFVDCKCLVGICYVGIHIVHGLNKRNRLHERDQHQPIHRK
ncbi:hypothetical protein EV401DRAFT_1967164 [Pisolithus croceorrhizus]|nr:hypothetical protein EV401DRAFT_1967164 [Pisolithus croceorrhizus]